MRNNVTFLVIGFVLGVAGLLGAIQVMPSLRPQRAEASSGGVSAEFQSQSVRREQMESRLLAELEKINASIEASKRPSNSQLESELHSDLQTLRSQLELYKIQHLERWPSQQPAVGEDGGKFVEQLTAKTDGKGEIGGTFGPYLRSWPANPFVKGDKSTAVKLGKGPCPGDRSTGWYFDTTKGVLSPNDPEHKNL